MIRREGEHAARADGGKDPRGPTMAKNNAADNGVPDYDAPGFGIRVQALEGPEQVRCVIHDQIAAAVANEKRRRPGALP